MYSESIIAGVQLLEERSGDDARFLSDLGGGSTTSSGQSMSWRKSLQNASVWSAIDLISGDISRTPIELWDVVDGERLNKVYNERWRVVAQRPNDTQNWMKFWRSYVVHLLLWGNGYARIIRDDFGELSSLELLLPDRTYWETSIGMYRSSLWREGNNWQDVLLDPVEVVHTQWMPDIDYNEMQGLVTWQMARDSWAMGLAHEDYLGSFFRSGGRAGGYLEVPDGGGDRARQQLESDFRSKYESSGEAFKAIMLPPGVKFQEGTFSPRDAMSAEAQDGHAKQIARWFGLPSSFLNVDGSVSYNSKTEDSEAYLSRTLAPFMTSIAAELTFKVNIGKMRNRWQFHYDTSVITGTGLDAEENTDAGNDTNSGIAATDEEPAGADDSAGVRGSVLPRGGNGHRIRVDG